MGRGDTCPSACVSTHVADLASVELLILPGLGLTVTDVSPQPPQARGTAGQLGLQIGLTEPGSGGGEEIRGPAECSNHKVDLALNGVKASVRKTDLFGGGVG